MIKHLPSIKQFQKRKKFTGSQREIPKMPPWLIDIQCAKYIWETIV